jgi:hypothetical protein
MSRRAAVGRAVATEVFHAQSESELPLTVGEEVTLYRFEGAPGWWLGGANGRVGWFPTSFVGNVVRHAPGEVDGGVLGNAPPAILRTAVALYDYTRCAPDELTFRAGDVIAVSENSPDGFVPAVLWAVFCVHVSRVNGVWQVGSGCFARCI